MKKNYLILLILCMLPGCVKRDTNFADVGGECKRLELVNFSDDRQYPSVFLANNPMASFNDTVYFMAKVRNTDTPEIWKYNVQSNEDAELLTELTKGSFLFQVNHNDKMFVQLFRQGRGMDVFDLKNEQVKHFPSDLDLSYAGYVESEKSLSFLHANREFTLLLGFNAENDVGLYELTKPVPRSSLDLLFYHYHLADAVVVSAKRPGEPVRAPKRPFLISRGETPTISELKDNKGGEVELVRWAFNDKDPYFVGKSDELGTRLWRLDRKEKQFYLASNVPATTIFDNPFGFTKFNDKIFFYAFNEYGKQIWSLDISANRPPEQLTHFPKAPRITHSPLGLVVVGDTLFFEVFDPAGEGALWSYTPGNDEPLKKEHDFNPGDLAHFIKDSDGNDTRERVVPDYSLSSAAGKLFVAVDNALSSKGVDLWTLSPECNH